MWSVLILLTLLYIGFLFYQVRRKNPVNQKDRKKESGTQEISKTALVENTVNSPSVNITKKAKKTKTQASDDVTNCNNVFQN